jgi:hypothetical protein
LNRAALGLALALSACGTLSGRTQRVAVDASPRGGAVRDAAQPKAPPLASTPAVVELERARTQALVFEAPPAAEAGDAPAPQVVEVECDFRWRVAGLGNTPFLLATLAQFGVGYVLAVGVDLWTGAAWDCPQLVRPPGSGTDGARRLFVLPPDHDDVAVQDALVASFAAAVRPSLGADETVLSPRDHRALLERIGAPRRLAMLPRHRLNTLLAGTGATHVVSLRWRTAETGTVFSGELLDGYRGGTTPVVGLEGPRVETPEGFTWQTLFQYLHFIPNSVAWLPGPTTFTPAARRDNWPALLEILGQWLSTFGSVDDAVKTLAASRIPGVPMLLPEEVIEHPHLAQRGAFPQVPHPVEGQARVTAQPFQLDGEPVVPAGPVPYRIGEHTRSVLTDWLGYSQEQVTGLISQGVVEQA